MSRRPTGPLRTRLRRLGAAVLAGGFAGAVLSVAAPIGSAEADQSRTAAARRTSSIVTPGDFTGYGFDQCLAPSQSSMDAWLESSPFLAVGIYISGNSRACRNQPNLTPTWVSTQLERGWRLLPITLGPQASCQPRFPRYQDDPTIIPKPGRYGRYGKARRQASAEATTAVGVAQRLGIAAGSTLWYDLEGFDLGNTGCRESALAFLSAWTTRIHQLGYVSGVYSSASSGIEMLDDARAARRKGVALPDQIWVARWSGVPGQVNDRDHTYLRADGWMPHARVHQYQGGHDETWGGVRINIDRDFLDLGRGSVAAPETHCGGVRVSFGRYPALQPRSSGYVPPRRPVKALKCLLTEQGFYSRPASGRWIPATTRAVKAWQGAHGFAVTPAWSRANWMSLLAAGAQPVLKYGSAGPDVRRVQRALNAAVDSTTPLPVTGVFDAVTTVAVKDWQRSLRLEVSGVVGTRTWDALAGGRQ